MEVYSISLAISFVLELEGLTENVYSRVFPLPPSQKYAGKRGHTWRGIDKYGGRWGD